jgi:ApaG protein
MTKTELNNEASISTKIRKKKPNFDISVKVVAEERESDVNNNVYAFSYAITIENKSQTTARLINRHWKVYSNCIQIADVKGEGVVGNQPLLRPKDSFEYSSWTVIKDPIGSMKGIFTFLTSTGDFFDLKIPEFDLVFKDRLTVH